MGGRSSKIEHDPDPSSKENEGTATIVKFCLMYVITIAVLVYEKFIKKAQLTAEEELAERKATGDSADPESDKTKDEQELDDEAEADAIAQARWTEPEDDNVSDEFRDTFIKTLTCGMSNLEQCPPGSALYFLSGVNWKKIGLTIFVFYALWVFLLTLSVMGTGFKLLGGKDSAKMFDVVDNPISALMVGILVTVLLQSSSTSTSIIISLVGANELSVDKAIFMVMGANIGTSVTNTIVAMGHFASKNELRRGFAAATVHDMFNWLCVCVMLPLNWMYPWLEKMTYEMAKDQKPCDEDAGDKCEKTEFLKPYISPYSKGVANYDKNVAKYVSQGYCNGQCQESLGKDQMKSLTELLCTKKDNGDFDCGALPGYKGSWMSSGYLYKKRSPLYMITDAAGKAAYHLSCPKDMDCSNAVNFFDDAGHAVDAQANTVYKTCQKFKTGLCDKPLLKGGLMLKHWELSDSEAGTVCTILTLASLCCCLFLIVYFLQTIVKGPAARILQKVVGFNGYASIGIGLVITILVQSSSITTSTLTPLCAVGLISLEDMFPLTLGANIGTTLTGIMGATVVSSNPVEAWQVALCHFFFNVFGILIWYPVPYMRNIPLAGARQLGKFTSKYGAAFPLAYTAIVFFVIPAICYGIAVAATS